MFNFREIRYFDIEGKLTGLRSQAMTSPRGKIRIPINESADDKSQIAEYLEAYHGEGIQHIALATNDIYTTGRDIGAARHLVHVGPRYLLRGGRRACAWAPEDLGRLRRDRILIDGAPGDSQGLLLQIFTDTVIGPIFLRSSSARVMTGLARAISVRCSKSIERDQIRRGVLSPALTSEPVR